MAFALSTVAIVGGAIAAAGGVAKAIDGGIKAKEAKLDAERAEKEMEKQKNLFASLDTSNPYLNMENTMEDLTVNQKEAQFMAQQSQQSQANILQSMRGAAGSSGIAALAQTLANQGALDAQKAAASIGAQEAANQKLRAEEASRIQGLEREGELISREAEMGKVSSLLGMAADEAAAARQAQAEFRDQMFEGISDTGGALMSMGGAKGGVGGSGSKGGVGSDIEKLLGDLSEEELQELIRKTGGDASGGGTGLQLPGGDGLV
tara:strand:+ start:4845 stop:5633 length:789 start_codon:yes stop_codon:yes gene_type:complete